MALVWVRFKHEPDARAAELMDLVGLKRFPQQSGLLQAGTMPETAWNDVLAIPGVDEIRVSVASLAPGTNVPAGAVPGEGKLSATTRLALAETPDDPEVAVFVEFRRSPTAAEQHQMEALGFRLVSGEGPIKTGRIRLRNITALAALECIGAIEATSPLYGDQLDGPGNHGPSDVEP
jgi:hypothetical protein